MKVTIVGAGSAGLASAIAVRTMLGAEVRILERAGEQDAPGLGVALLPFAIQELKAADPSGFPDFERTLMPIEPITQVFAGPGRGGEIVRKTRLQDTQYWGVKRSTLLDYLKSAARKAGVGIDYRCEVTPERLRDERAAADLLVGADGAGSAVRQAYESEFRPTGGHSKSRYAWLELEGSLSQFVFGYLYVGNQGLLRISTYPHGRDISSAILTHSMGLNGYFDRPEMVDADGSISDAALSSINGIFAGALGGRRLSGRARWRQFRGTHCQKASFGNVALVGDALATLHYETGWGTSAALQEARILPHIIDDQAKKGLTLAEGVRVYDRKAIAIAGGLVKATARTMREIDGQSAKFFQLGAAKFLELKTP